jgi:transposase
MSRPRKYPEELVQRGLELALGSRRPVGQIARELGIGEEVLRKRVRQAQAGEAIGTDLPATAEGAELVRLRRENAELRRANEILKAASVFFASELDADRPK